jgi:hypothetical protein
MGRDDDRSFNKFERHDFPATVVIAGCLWIAFGCVVLLNLFVKIALMAVIREPGNGEDASGALAVSSGASMVLIAVIGAAFLLIGIQSIRGTATDVLGNSIGSLVFGLLYLGVAALQFHRGDTIGTGIFLSISSGLIAASILALVGRRAYRQWRYTRENHSQPH